jgi:hypothetical protein
MIRFIGTSIAITIDYNSWQSWLPKTRSFPYCTTSVFSSAVTNDERRITAQTSNSLTKSELYVTTDGQSASLSWNKAPIWDLRPERYYCQTAAGLLMGGALSDERTGLSFTIAAVPRQRSHFQVFWPHFTVSDSRLPFSSPPTTRRVTVEVFDPASTRETFLWQSQSYVTTDGKSARLVGLPRDWSSNPSRGKIFLLSTSSRQDLRPTKSSYSMGTGDLPPGVKRLRREADHLPPTSAEIKNTWIYASNPPYSFMAWCLIS